MKLRNQSEFVIHCIGDSHVDFLSGANNIQPEWPLKHYDKLPLFKTYRLGAALAYTISDPKSVGNHKLKQITKSLPKGATIMLMLGEIDCRVHLLKQAELQKRSVENVVNECVDKYFKTIVDLKNEGFTLLVWHVIPSTIFEVLDSEYPTYGSSKERNRVTVLFNKRLSHLAEQNNLPVISIYKQLVNQEGKTHMKYFIDAIHLSSRAVPLVINELKEKVTLPSELVPNSLEIDWLNYLCFYIRRRLLNFLLLRLRVYPAAQRLSRHFKKMRNTLALLGVIILAVVALYSPLLKSFFQQDEWLAFGHYYSLNSHTSVALISKAFAPNIGHYIPLYFLSFYALMRLIGTNFVAWQVISISWHVAITILVFILFRKSLKNDGLALIGAALFGLSGASHQATSWVVADTNTHGAALFGLVSLIFAIQAAEAIGHRKQQYILGSIVSFLISLLFKETTVALFICSPLLYLTFKSVDRKQLTQFSKFWLLAGGGYVLMRALMFLLPQSQGTASVATQSQTIGTIALNLLTFPAKAFSLDLVPSMWWLRGSHTVLSKSLGFFGVDSRTTAFHLFTEGFLGLVFIIIFLVMLLFTVRAWKLKKQDIYSKLMVYSFIFVSLNSMIFALSPERSGVITIIDSRNLYFTSIGSILFLLSFMKKFMLHTKTSFILLGITLLLILNTIAMQMDFHALVSAAETRKQILVQIKKNTQPLTNRVVIYTESDSSYFGLPDEEKILPFQSGFGQTLLINFSGKNKFPTSFYSQSFLWPLASQGYKEESGMGFGYFRKYDDLLETVKKQQLPLDDIYAFRWNSQTEALLNMTTIIRQRLKKDL